MYQTPNGLMEARLQYVTFSKQVKDEDTIIHHARIVTYVDVKKRKFVSLLTNDQTSDPVKKELEKEIINPLLIVYVYA